MILVLGATIGAVLQHVGSAQREQCGRLTAYLVDRDPKGLPDPRGYVVPCQASFDCSGSLSFTLSAGCDTSTLTFAAEVDTRTWPKCSAQAHRFFDGSSLAFEFCQDCGYFTTLTQDQL